MIGGLLFSQSLTLLSTPALYVIFSCLAERWRARRARRREAKLLKRAQRRRAAHPRMAWIYEVEPATGRLSPYGESAGQRPALPWMRMVGTDRGCGPLVRTPPGLTCRNEKRTILIQLRSCAPLRRPLPSPASLRDPSHCPFPTRGRMACGRPSRTTIDAAFPSPRLALLASALSAACAAHAEAPAVSRKATDLDAVNVTAERPHTDAGALGDRALRDTPFAITAVGREQIEQRQVVSLGEAFLLDPSVTTQVSAYASGWSSPIRNRGIELNFDSYRVNGLQVSSWGTEWPLEVMEQVDLLKGPGGFLYGFGAPGGIVNYITKKPTDTPTFSAQLGWREQGIVSGGIDVGGRFGNEQMFGYRFNAFRKRARPSMVGTSIARLAHSRWMPA